MLLRDQVPTVVTHTEIAPHRPPTLGENVASGAVIFRLMVMFGGEERMLRAALVGSILLGSLVAVPALVQDAALPAPL